MKLLLLFVLCCSGPALGSPTRELSEDSAVAPPTPYQIHIRFYTWPLRGILHDQMDVPALPRSFLSTPQGPKPVVLARGGLSSPIFYQGEKSPGLISVLENGKNPETGEPHREATLLARLAIPKEWRQCVVILFPDNTLEDGSWRTLPLETGELSLPAGGSRFLNTSRRPLVLELNEKQMPLAPGKSYTLKEGGGNDRVRIRIYGQHPIHRKVELIYTSSHWRDEQTGNLYVIYPISQNRLQVLQLSPKELQSEEESIDPQRP